jgi:hypothetical protein
MDQYTRSSGHRNAQHYPLPPARRRNGNGNGHRPSLAGTSVSGRNLAHARRTASERAALAVALLRGEVHLVQPTLKQACLLAGVSPPYAAAVARLSDDARELLLAGKIRLADVSNGNGLVREFAAASPAEKIALTRIFGADRIFDQVIEPAL